MNKNVSMLKKITKFLLLNLIVFTVPIVLIWMFSDSGNAAMVEKVLLNLYPEVGLDTSLRYSLIVSFSLLLCSFVFLAWSICKLYKYLITKLSKALSIVMAVIISAIYVGIFRGALVILWLIDSFYYEMPSSRESINYIGEHFVWFGGALFVATLVWKVSKIYKKGNIMKNKNNTSPLKLVANFALWNIIFIAITYILMMDLANGILLMPILFTPCFIYFIYSAYILMRRLKEVIKSSKAFDIFSAAITSFLDTLLFVGILFLLELNLVFVFGFNFRFIEKYIESNLPWYMIAFFMARLTWKVYKRK